MVSVAVCALLGRGIVIAIGIGRFETEQIFLPQTVLMGAKIVEHVPRIKSRVMTVGKYRFDPIVAYRLNGADVDIPFAGLQDLLSRRVAAYFCRGTEHTEQFKRQPEASTIGEGNFHYSRLLMKLDFGGNRCIGAESCHGHVDEKKEGPSLSRDLLKAGSVVIFAVLQQSRQTDLVLTHTILKLDRGPARKRLESVRDMPPESSVQPNPEGEDQNS